MMFTAPTSNAIAGVGPDGKTIEGKATPVVE